MMVAIKLYPLEAKIYSSPVNHQKYDWDNIHTLWNELADFEAAQTESARRHLMRTLAEWLQAVQAIWVGAGRIQHGAPARRDPQRGWRARVTTFPHSTSERKQRITRDIRAQDTRPSHRREIINRLG